MDTMISGGADWHADLQEWLQSFLAASRPSEQRCWVPLYLHGLLGPGARKSVEPMAERVCPGQTQQHHFVSTSPWPMAPLEQVLRKTDGSSLCLQNSADPIPQCRRRPSDPLEPFPAITSAVLAAPKSPFPMQEDALPCEEDYF